MDSMQHVLAGLEVIDLMIRLQVVRFRAEHRRDDAYRGLYISEDDVDALLEGRSILPTWYRGTASAELEPLVRLIDQRRSALATAEETALREGRGFPLLHLARAFGLTRVEVEALLVALAPEIDLRYERLYAYLQDDVTKKRPTVDLILNLLSSSFDHRMESRARFGGDGPLVRHRLLVLFDEHPERPGPLLAKFVRVDEGIVSYLLGGGSLDHRLAPVARLCQPEVQLDDVILPHEVREAVRALARMADAPGAEESRPEAAICVFQGRPGVGKKMAAEVVVQSLGTPLLVVDCERVMAGGLAPEDLLLAFREPLLKQAALYLDHFDALLADDPRAASTRLAVEMHLAQHPGLVFVGTQALWEPVDQVRRPVARLSFPDPDLPLRRCLWNRYLPTAKATELDELANLYTFPGGAIRAVANGAAQRAAFRGGTMPFLSDVIDAVRSQSNQRLVTFAQKITPRRAWADLVLPADRLEQLRELGRAVRYRPRVYVDWEFEKTLTLGRGIAALFAGPPGTGKTMAAEVIAGDLGLELYRIDLSTVVSKYIGETEKNLSRIFAEAQTSNAILLFDEADALFGKRTEVRDAHDRYANLEVAYLLQKMEEYEGVAILATNLRQNVDEAFLRRLYAIVDFPFPDEAIREQIWRGIFPRAAPVDPGVDFEFLARQFSVAGGSIKNIAVMAAFMAAADGVIRMEHVICAAQREFQKLGKPCLPSDFGPYYGLVVAEVSA